MSDVPNEAGTGVTDLGAARPLKLINASDIKLRPYPTHVAMWRGTEGLSETPTLVWSCDRCQTPIEDGEGFLYYDRGIYLSRADRYVGEEPWVEGSDPTTTAPVGFLHRSCMSDDETFWRWYDIDRIRSEGQFHRLMFHNEAKRWSPWVDITRMVEAARHQGVTIPAEYDDEEAT